jgi:Thioesterase-like superfamily
MSGRDDHQTCFAIDGTSFVPSPIAQGPWGETVSGHMVGGLLGWAVERAGGDPLLQPARLTVDLLRPTFMKPVEVQTFIRREGKRIKVVDAEVVQEGVVASRASAVFLRRGEHPEGNVWTPPVSMPPVPDYAPPPRRDATFLMWAYGADAQSGTGGTEVEWEQAHSRKFVWVRELHPLIEGEETTPFTRAALAGDVTSAVTHWGTARLRYINVDFTLSLHRLPEGEFIGLAVDGHHGTEGVASGAATVFDCHGPIGHSIAIGLAQPSNAFRPIRRSSQ